MFIFQNWLKLSLFPIFLPLFPFPIPAELHQSAGVVVVEFAACVRRRRSDQRKWQQHSMGPAAFNAGGPSASADSTALIKGEGVGQFVVVFSRSGFCRRQGRREPLLPSGDGRRAQHRRPRGPAAPHALLHGKK